jgi:hypothetical protein
VLSKTTIGYIAGVVPQYFGLLTYLVDPSVPTPKSIFSLNMYCPFKSEPFEKLVKLNLKLGTCKL